MKTLLSILSIAVVTVVSGCEQKTPSVSNTTAPVTETAPKPLETIAPTTETKQKPAKTATTKPVSTENTAAVIPKNEVQTPRSTEQSLAEISTHGREITKTQTSKARNRAQAAEDDMLKDLSSDK